MTVEDELEREGFVHHERDEPHEDYWILETGGDGDVMLERENDAWSLFRAPREHEPQGTWVDVATGMGEEECLLALRALLGRDHSASATT